VEDLECERLEEHKAVYMVLFSALLLIGAHGKVQIKNAGDIVI
jgi:hypothetical protein